MTHDNTTLLRDLARAKAAFQQRTVEAIITEGRDKPAPVLRQPDMLEGL
jgi:hypothetical protein